MDTLEFLCMNRIASVVWLLQNSSALNLKATSDPYSASNSLTHKKIVTIWIKKLRIFFSVNARKCSNAHTHWLSFPIFWSIGQLLLYCAATADRVIGGWASALFFSAVQRNKKIRSLSRTFFWHKKKSVALHTLQAPTELENPFLLSWKNTVYFETRSLFKKSCAADCRLPIDECLLLFLVNWI